MKTLHFLVVIAIATFFGTWAQVTSGGRVCYGVTHDSDSGSITSQSVLSLCDDATNDHWTSLGPVFPFSATSWDPSTATKPSAIESSSSIIQGTEIHSPTWSLTSSTEQTSSIKTYYTFTTTGETSGGPSGWSTSLASGSSLSETFSGAPSASLASTVPVSSNTGSATSSPTTLTGGFTSSLSGNGNTSVTTGLLPSTSKPKESALSSNSTTTMLLSSKSLRTSAAVASSTVLSSGFVPTLVQPTVTSSNSSTTQSRVLSTSSDGLLVSASPVVANLTLSKVESSSTLENLTTTTSRNPVQRVSFQTLRGTNQWRLPLPHLVSRRRG
jgi:hypothetical protein